MENKEKFLNELTHKLNNWRNGAPHGDCLVVRDERGGKVSYLTANGTWGTRDEAMIIDRALGVLITDVLSAVVNDDATYTLAWDKARRGGLTVNR